MENRKRIIQITLLTVCLCIVFVCSACAGDLPPSDGTPAPAALDGVFTSKYGTLTFDGDGRSIEIDASEELSEKSGLPSGESKGTYVFLFHNEEWRYDKAETLRITVDGVDYTFQNAVGTTNSKTLVFYLPDGSMISFDKTEE